MGFGLLLIGYVLSFVAIAGMGEFMFAGMLIGGFLMYLGLSELRKYSPVFIYALIASILIIVCSVFKLGVWLNTWLSLELAFFSPITQSIIEWVKFALYLVFDFSMLYGIADLSRRVELSDTRTKAIKNMVFVAIYGIFQLITRMPFMSSIGDGDKQAVLMLLLIVQLVYTVLNSFLIFNCYAMICPEGQEEMPRKPSRFAFINKWRAIRDAHDEKAAEEMKNYYEERLRRKNDKRKKKSGKKKK